MKVSKKVFLSLSTITSVWFGVERAYAALDIPKTESALCGQAAHPNSPFVEDYGICGTSGNRFGASIAIGRGEKIIYEESIGSASASGDRAVKNANLFRLASIHKPITAIGVMKLVEQGQLQLTDLVFGPNGIIDDSDVIEIIPPGSAVADITVDHLLRHTSGWSTGLSYVPFSLWRSGYPDAPNGIAFKFGERNRADLDTFVKYMAQQEPVVAPGTRHAYNNMNYLVLNKVIEEASGMSYDQYMKTAIFDPLGIEEIKPAKTFPDDRYSKEVEYIWPSKTEPTNQHPSYCTGRNLPSQYGYFRHEGTWIGSARAVTKLFMAIDKSSSVKILSNSTIDLMFHTISIQNQNGDGSRNVARGWIDTALTDSNAGDWAFSGGMAGTGARFAKFNGNFVTYIRNANRSENEPSNEVLWDTYKVIEELKSELGSMGSASLDAAPSISRPEDNSEWKPPGASQADLRAGCHSYVLAQPLL